MIAEDAPGAWSNQVLVPSSVQGDAFGANAHVATIVFGPPAHAIFDPMNGSTRPVTEVVP